VLIAGVAILQAHPAAAQFFNPFEALFGTPPRPPSNVPTNRPQSGYAYPDYDQRYSAPQNQAIIPRQGPPMGVQSEPLAPPPGATAAIPLDPPGGQRPRGTALPGDTSPRPGDEVIAEPPAQKVENKSALFTGLDKITGRTINFDVAIGETVQFGALQVTPRACYTRPPTETPNTDAFIEVDEVTLQGEIKRIFTGWTFASSPGLHAVEHPIYDVWLTDCKNPVVAAVAPPEPPPPAATPAPAPAKPSAPKRSTNAAPRPAPQGIFPR
jgi:hypothetical protein